MKNNYPKISVIMPSLNVRPFIKECIESVINQTFRDLEIICVDAGSTDGTLEILKEYAKKDSRINIIQSNEKSYGHQMNIGIEASKGEYIGIVETDDFIDEKMYETLYQLTDSSADIAKVNFYHYSDENNFKADTSKLKLPKTAFNVYENETILNGHPSIWAAIYKKTFLEKNNIKFMEAPGGGWVDNPFLFETTLCAKKIVYDSDAFYYYRESNPDSSTNDLKDLTLPMRRMLDNFDVLEKYSCNDENILKAFYVRIFWHIKDVLKKENYKNQKMDVFKYSHKVVCKMNEDIVKKHFTQFNQKFYYKYLSPLTFKENDKSISLTGEEYDYALSENEFLYDYIEKLEKENSKLRSKNRKIKNTNKKIKNSKSYKIAKYFSKKF